MAVMMECNECGHVQSVGIIDNGIGGFPDPHQACENCGQTGRFSAVGSRNAIEERAAEFVRAFKEKDEPASKKLTPHEQCEGMGV